MRILKEIVIEVSIVLLLLTLLVWTFFNGFKGMTKPVNNVSISIIVEDCNISVVDSIISYIKSHEGYRSIPYKCLGGAKTIGYGHVIQKTDTFTIPIDEVTAEKILIEDFYNSVRYATTLTNLKGNKLLAISHFIYAVGVTNFLKSKLPYLIKNNLPIEDELIKWCKVDGKPNAYLLKIRLWELKLYNK